MDRTERNAMIVEHLPLVGYIVADVRSRATHLDRDDLAAVGSLALVAAADAFDPTLGVPFGAYARTRVTGAIADDMRSADWASRGTRKRIRETLATQEALSARLGRSVGVQEIADAMGVDRQAAADAMSDAARTVAPLDETVHDLVAAELPLPGDDLLETEKRRYLVAAVQALPERMRFIVEAVYFGDRTVTDVATELGITHSAVSQQRSEAMRLLRDGLSAHYGDGGPAPEHASRTTAARRSAYLARVATNAAAGVARAVHDAASGPAVAAS
ncbi:MULTISPECIES: sigma-70 family RNA polymerase sigma factor [unclassified Curtobacterium]|uniref:sigma-70 family RNA polymerase sigma factor n=1 Tax=unclassified Curtobacterium TaxID=257496 RepID=UPI0008DD51EA|nr:MULTISPECIES: sigma-70 family RNA polymerase sigma factor [unclassified Curtobacterium]OIH98529.1 flagellar biosynthesis protein FliA [Curtobacterium sp. MCBA15_003]OII12802.1 flagellar biosynthesis protein FliA [Curtobacterium sp. MCBA15_009]OII32254.1 flagellar biosynthesis protein FliA [Curtobacterium sp. MMLR14_006]WIE66530.1 sigma-70 family RNA polymerase sigma factor [Curtobacterium sp. MCLR17_036]